MGPPISRSLSTGRTRSKRRRPELVGSDETYGAHFILVGAAGVPLSFSFLFRLNGLNHGKTSSYWPLGRSSAYYPAR